ncbi:MAG: hypothetical protein JXB35_09940 [Anaerolineae bacterium]|nr:hypothetical protein [Anaerolineae bacterium]
MKTRAVPHKFTTWLACLVWGIALAGYFGPWIGHRAAALAWNAYDLFDIVRVLPEIETFALVVDIQTLRLPLVGLAVLLPLALHRLRPGWRWLATVVSLFILINTLPPYPQIIGAWSKPGWRVPFWWGSAGMAAAAGLAAFGPRLGRWRPWLGMGWVLLTGIPAFITLQRLLPAIRRLYAAPVMPGWGYWTCAAGLLGLALLFCCEGLWDLRRAARKAAPAKTETASMESKNQLTYVREVKAKYESRLLKQANVIGVGIGVEETEHHDERLTLIVNVRETPSGESPDAGERIPEELDGVPVKIERIAPPQAQSPET